MQNMFAKGIVSDQLQIKYPTDTTTDFIFTAGTEKTGSEDLFWRQNKKVTKTNQIPVVRIHITVGWYKHPIVISISAGVLAKPATMKRSGPEILIRFTSLVARVHGHPCLWTSFFPSLCTPALVLPWSSHTCILSTPSTRLHVSPSHASPLHSSFLPRIHLRVSLAPPPLGFRGWRMVTVRNTCRPRCLPLLWGHHQHRCCHTCSAGRGATTSSVMGDGSRGCCKVH